MSDKRKIVVRMATEERASKMEYKGYQVTVNQSGNQWQIGVFKDGKVVIDKTVQAVGETGAYQKATELIDAMQPQRADSTQRIGAVGMTVSAAPSFPPDDEKKEKASRRMDVDESRRAAARQKHHGTLGRWHALA